MRELENVIERAVILSPTTELQVPPGVLKSLTARPARAPTADNTLADAERQHILRVLRDTNWVLGGSGGAAAKLGMKRTTLQSKMKKLNIARPR